MKATGIEVRTIPKMTKERRIISESKLEMCELVKTIANWVE